MRILTLNRIGLFFLFIIFLGIKSCISTEDNISEEDIIKEDIQKSLLPDGDQVTLNTLEDYLVLNFDKNNKNKYIAYLNILPNNILKIELHKFTFIDNINEKIANNYIIENNNNYKYEILYNKEDINFSIKDFYLKEEYNNMLSYKSHQNNEHQLSFIDLTKEDFCSDKNSFVFSTEKENHELILKLSNNNNLNNLSCSKKQIIPLLNKYTFKDQRDFSLLPQKLLLSNIKENIQKTLKNYPYIDFYYDDEYFYFYLNQEIKNKKSIKIIKGERKFTLQLSELDINNSIPISSIKITQNDMLNNPEFNLDIVNYSESKYYTETREDNIDNLINISFYKEDFSILKNLDCQKYSYASLEQVFNNESIIYINKNNHNQTYQCNIKPLISQISFNDKLKFKDGDLSKNLFLQKNFNIEYDDDTLLIKGKNDYNVYDYLIENDQLFIYVDKPSKEYILINEKIENLKIPYFSSVNVINVEHDNFYNSNMNNVFMSYRQINEDLNINIFKFNHLKNVEYYLLRSNTIQFDNNMNTCNFNFKINKIATYKYDFNISDEMNSDCDKYGVSVIVIKKIGYNTELNFKENRSDLLLNHLKDKHDLFHKSLNSINSDKFKISVSLLLKNKNDLNYSIDLVYLNDNFDIEYKTEIIDSQVYLFLKETNNIKNKEKESIIIPFNNTKKINIIYEDLDGAKQKFNLKY